MYTSSIQPFSRRKYGRGSCLTITNQYAGKYKWASELKQKYKFLHTRKWKSQSIFSLDKFIYQNCNAFVSMQQCAVHVEFQLPNEYYRVGYLLDAINKSHASFQSAIALVFNDDTPNTGKRSNFEATAACLLRHDPVAKKRNAKPQCRSAEMSATDSRKIKSVIGSTGVYLCYLNRDKYSKLSPEKKKELHEWREADPHSKNNKPDDKQGKRASSSGLDSNKAKKMKRIISSAVADELKLRKETKYDTGKKVEYGAYLLSLVQAHASSTTETTPNAATPKPSPAVTLQRILKLAENGRH